MTVEAASPPASVREHPAWRFLGLLLASLFGHAVCFYLLQVEYSPVSSRPPVPARIYLPVPGSPEAVLVAAWAEMADPSALVLPADPPVEEVLKKARPEVYEPSFAARAPRLEETPAPKPNP